MYGVYHYGYMENVFNNDDPADRHDGRGNYVTVPDGNIVEHPYVFTGRERPRPHPQPQGKRLPVHPWRDVPPERADPNTDEEALATIQCGYANADELIVAWQFIHDTGFAYEQEDAWFGKTCRKLINEGIIDEYSTEEEWD